MMAMQRETVGLAPGTRGQIQPGMDGAGGIPTDPPGDEIKPGPTVTLADAGIDKNLAARARKLHGLPEGGVDGHISSYIT
jgi:hypothetical protein